MNNRDSAKKYIGNGSGILIMTGRLAACGQNYFSGRKLLEDIASNGFNQDPKHNAVVNSLGTGFGILCFAGASLVILTSRGPKVFKQCYELIDSIGNFVDDPFCKFRCLH